MKNFVVSFVVVFMGSFVVMPNMEAQGRGGGVKESNRSSQQVSKSRSSGNNDNKAVRPNTPSNNRPDQGNVRPGGQQPGNPDGQQPSKPGGRQPGKPEGQQPSKPGGQQPGKPGGQQPSKPGKGPEYGPAHKPDPNPNYKPGSRPSSVAPPSRPGRPIYPSAWPRPVPPSNWHSTYPGYLVPNVFGMTFGMAINSALDYLWYEGYVIDGYGANEVYLRDVYEMGYYWEEATLFFVGNKLDRTQFYDSSTYYDSSKYNSVYNSLTAKFGSPVSQNGMSATWFGYYGDYITLEYQYMNGSSGYRYYTILTYGR